jgi:hypothetical protein
MKRNYTLQLGLAIALMTMNFCAQGQTYTFTNATATGGTGPTQTNVNAEYTGTTLAGAVTATAGIQSWTVPTTGNYSIQALGAAGGGINGGLGASITGEFALTSGDVLQILVGQQGSEVDLGTGGGGGSYVVLTGSPIIVAGGGGGNNTAASNANCNGQDGQDGLVGMGSSGTGAGGVAGNAGTSVDRAQGGAGWLQDGPVLAQSTTDTPAQRFLNGGNGGFHNTSPGGLGGFGGGGGSWNTGFRGSAGGGGYSGGGTGYVSSYTNNHYGGGAGSFNSGTSPVNLAGVQSGHGSVIIMRVCAIDNGASQTGSVLTADSAGYTYQWLDCDNGYAIISGATNQTYTPTAGGNYAVELTDNGCVDTSACLTSTVGINELNNQSFVMYPNPSIDGMFTITTNSTIVQINVTDAVGRTIQLQADSNTGLVDGSSLASGKYIVRVITKKNTFIKRLMILK